MSQKKLSEAQLEQRKEAIKARWTMESLEEQATRTYFSEIDVEEGLAILGKMRLASQYAGEELNRRLTADDCNQKCHTCGGSQKPNKQWALLRPVKDPLTGLVRNQVFCTIYCIAMENQKDYGVKAVQGRGMVKDEQGEPVSELDKNV